MLQPTHEPVKGMGEFVNISWLLNQRWVDYSLTMLMYITSMGYGVIIEELTSLFARTETTTFNYIVGKRRWMRAATQVFDAALTVKNGLTLSGLEHMDVRGTIQSARG